MRLKLTLVLALVFLFTSAFPAFAAEVKTFGFDDNRRRDNNVAGIHFVPAWRHDGGASYSQPLILSGDRWGGRFAGKKLVVAVEGNTLNGYVDPGGEPSGFKPIDEKYHLWAVRLSGDVPTKSHPTFVEKGGRKYVYIGTYSPYLDIVDITDFGNVDQSKLIPKETLHTTDITSAPLVLNWRGHEIVICTSGNTGKINIITDPLLDKSNVFFINAGSGRTSSSPAPVAGGAGFAVGLDGGYRVRGELQIYYLDDILQEGQDGKVELKSQNYRVRKLLPSGLVASFAVDGDMLYFGDSNSNVYAYNIATGNMAKNSDNAGIFSNRSPALTPTRVYFPSTGYAPENEPGMVLAIDRATGETVWTPFKFPDTAQTAPVVFRSPQMPGLLEGTGNGYLVFINPVDGSEINEFEVSRVLNSESYARGITGEISAMDDLAVVGTEMGVVAFRLQPLGNLKAVSLDLGVPAGQKAEPGQEYTATVVFENESDRDYTEVPVALFHGEYQAILYDENGQVLPKKIVDGKEIQVADFDKKGSPKSKRTFTTKWHPLNKSRDGLTGYVNHKEIGLALRTLYPELTYADNVIASETPVNFQNLRVELISYPQNVTEDDVVNVSARVFNDSEDRVITKVVWKVNGSVVKEIDNFDLFTQADTTVSFTMPGSSVVVEVEVNPDHNSPPDESTWSDNKATCTIASIGKPSVKSGDIQVTILAPGRVEPFKSWAFSVEVSGYFPPISDKVNGTAAVTLYVSGQSKNVSYRLSEGTFGDPIITEEYPADFSETVTFEVERGSTFEVTKYFRFPSSSGYPGMDFPIKLYAEASWSSYSGSDTATVMIYRDVIQSDLKLTQ